jgi:hypothetical protein
MKRYLIFAIIAVSTLLFASCEQEPQPSYPNGDLPIFNGYMQFSTEVSTRSDLATNMRGRNFGVLGYSYSYTTDWEAAKTLATPDTFYNQQVLCDADGICRYDIDSEEDGNQLKPWDATKWYTFFAYSPYNGAGITLSDANVASTPYLTYEYAWLDDALAIDTSDDNPDNDSIDVYGNNKMFDLMTAEHVDADGSTNVGLNFKHRLFAIEVLANNYNESDFEMEQKVDENGNPVLDKAGEPVMVIKKDAQGKPILVLNDEGNPVNDQSKIIKDLTLTVKGLTHTSMTIPLSMRSEEMGNIEYHPSGDGATYPLKEKDVTFNIQNQEVKIPAFNDPQPDGRGGGVATSISKLGSTYGDGYLMFIPQEGSLKFTVVATNVGDDPINKTIESNVNSFEAGKLYQIIVNFVGDGITIALIEAGAWDYKSVKHTFE